MEKQNRLRKDIEQAINKHSAENGSNTPDFILAEYLIDCLNTFDKTITKREEWYEREEKRDKILIEKPSMRKKVADIGVICKDVESFKESIFKASGRELHKQLRHLRKITVDDISYYRISEVRDIKGYDVDKLILFQELYPSYQDKVKLHQLLEDCKPNVKICAHKETFGLNQIYSRCRECDQIIRNDQ